MSPITVSPRAEEVFRTPQDEGAELVLRSFHGDELLGQGSLYHHTPPISLIYALRESNAHGD